jgi:hypothetical protein
MRSGQITANPLSADTGAALLSQLLELGPTQIRSNIEALRERSRQCAELASDCITDEARRVLSGMARGFDCEADEVERALVRFRQFYADDADERPAVLFDN